MAVGLSGFAQGFAQGFNQTSQTLMAAEKAKRENELTDMKIAEAKKEQAYKDEIGQLYKSIATGAQGGTVGGEAVDETGASLGKMQFASQAEADEAMKTQGLKFKEGTTIQKEAKDPFQLEREFADGLKLIGAKYGKIDLQTLKAAREFDKELKSEGALEAMQYALANPNDQEGIRKTFKSKGKMEIPEDVMIGIKPGIFGKPSVYGYKLDANGKQVEVFDGFNDIILPSLGAKAYSTIQAQLLGSSEETKAKIGIAGMQVASAEKIASAKSDGEDKPEKRLEGLIKSRYEALAKSFESNAEINRWKLIEGELGSLASKYVSAGYKPLEAIDKAQALVFDKYKVDTGSLISNTKKK